jgi:glycosyltransferase involved in cell wall biosynthesis
MMTRRAERETNVLKRLYFKLEGTRIARYERAIASQFALHITCSDLDSERLKATMPGARLLAVPNGVDTAFFAPTGLTQTPNSMVFVGTLNWYPNVDAVIFILRDIWPALRSRVPGVTLDIVGAGAPRSLAQLAARSPGVTMHGFVPEIRPIIERASLYLCPIRDGGGTKLKVLDALAMGKCIVAHPVACEGIAVTPGLDILFAESAPDFVEQIARLLPDANRRADIGRAARKLAEREFSFDAIGEDFAAALSSVANT